MFQEERIGEILRQLSLLVCPLSLPVEGWRFVKTPGETRPGEVPEDSFPFSEGDLSWGEEEGYYAFQAELVLPESLAGRRICFSLLTGREGLWDAVNPQFTVYIDGRLRQGFDVNHHDLLLTEKALPGETHTLYLSAYTGSEKAPISLRGFLSVEEEEVKKAYYDLLVPWECACLLDPKEASCQRLLDTLRRAVNLLDLRRPLLEDKSPSPAFLASLQEMEDFLQENLYQPESPLRKLYPPEATVHCVGHTHIDVAWLWPLSVTRRKAVRSFATVLELMDRYPEYVFFSSQPQLYQYVKELAPELYERIRERVKEGRWEADGGMFVEPDTNLPSGESLVRQLLYGKGFFRRDFGKDSRVLWLPDVFGYSAALPQILKKSGIRYFQTTKISWNEVNLLPYDTFYWEGIDGTRILTHFITTRDYESPARHPRTSSEFTTGFTTSYNGILNPSQVKGAWQRYQQKALSPDILCCFGYGDGGGGPTAEMLEKQRRLSGGLPCCPETRMNTALSFFQALEKNLAGKKVPLWCGELYLEYHRATYTSMARNKRYNRKAEFAAVNLESLERIAKEFSSVSSPREVLKNGWEVILRNQFHDILPGSAIYEVYEDSKREYEDLFAALGKETERLLCALTEGQGSKQETEKEGEECKNNEGGKSSGKNASLLVLNLNGLPLKGLVKTAALPWETGKAQKTPEGDWLLSVGEVPAKGFCLVSEKDLLTPAEDCLVTESLLETPFARIRLDENGQIEEWYDKRARRNILKEGQRGNVLTAYEDKPYQYDNWNLYDYYLEKPYPVQDLLSRRVVENGPLRYGLELRWRYQDSVIKEVLYVYPDNPRVDFSFWADWKESQTFLKALFPLDLNTREAAYEIQYGHVKRPTHRNTSWDQARFETCMHKWMDVSEGGFGVSLLNDCKYGVSVEDGVVGLSLIKCGNYPNPQADRGIHEAVYSLLPHEGTWAEAGVVPQAYLLNNPLLARPCHNPALPSSYSLASCRERNICLEVFKEAEEGNASILRLYEFENRRGQATLTFPSPQRVTLCNLLEEEEELLSPSALTLTLPVRPFEILTLKLAKPEG